MRSDGTATGTVLPLYVNHDNTAIEHDAGGTRAIVWSAQMTVPYSYEFSNDVVRIRNAFYEKTSVVDGKTTLDWPSLKRGVEESSSNVTSSLPADFFEHFDETGLDAVFTLLANSALFEFGRKFSLDKGEMMLQQLAMPPITILFMAAAKNLSYKADEPVESGVFYKKPLLTLSAEQGPTCAKLASKPDAAILLAPVLTLASCEFKVGNANVGDFFKSCLGALITVLVLAKMDIYDVSLPFLVSGGLKVQLYVVKKRNGDLPPEIWRVPSTEFEGYTDTFTMSHDVQVHDLLYWLVALLYAAKLKTKDTSIRHAFNKDVPNVISKSDTSEATSSPRKRKPPNPDNKTGKKNTPPSPTTAASLNGLVGAVVTVDPDKTSSSAAHDQHQTYYYYGTDRDSGRSLFIKVYPPLDVDDAKDEVEMQRLAHKNIGAHCRIPEVIHSVEIDGYGVIAMERVLDDDDVDAEDIRRYATSLLRSIQALHDAGLLHCDIKPSNIMWRRQSAVHHGSVVVVDFGHAQLVKGARSYRGTRGYTAPEVAVDKESHSAASDAYSVGKTIEQVAEEAGATEDGTLAAIVAGLTKAAAHERLTLKEALDMLEPSTPQTKRPRTNHGATKVTPPAEDVSSSPVVVQTPTANFVHHTHT